MFSFQNFLSFLSWSFLKWCVGYGRVRWSSTLAKRGPPGPWCSWVWVHRCYIQTPAFYRDAPLNLKNGTSVVFLLMPGDDPQSAVSHGHVELLPRLAGVPLALQHSCHVGTESREAAVHLVPGHRIPPSWLRCGFSLLKRVHQTPYAFLRLPLLSVSP